MSRRPQRQDRNNDTQSPRQAEYGLRELYHFINEVQFEAKLDERIIRRVTGKITRIDTQIEDLIARREFGVDFVTESKFNMCFLDLQTAPKDNHQTMTKCLRDAFKLKAELGQIYRNPDAWIIDIFCYDDLENPTADALAVILLRCLTDRFCSKIAPDEFLPLKGVHRPPKKGSVPPRLPMAVEILQRLVEQIFKRFPKVSLIFIIGGITTTDYLCKERLATLVVLLGQLMEIVRMTTPHRRIKCLFCGNGFLSKKPGDGKFDAQSLLAGVLRLVVDQANRINGYDQLLREITNRMLIFRWLEKKAVWDRVNINVHGASDGENSQALVPASSDLTAR